MKRRQGFAAVPQQGFSLVEVTIALAIAAFCLITVFGLIVTGLNSNRDSVRQTAEASLARNLAVDLRSTAATASVSPIYGLNLSPTAIMSTTIYLREDGSINILPLSGSDPVYRATVMVMPPAATYPHSASMALIKVTWPPTVDPSTATPSGIYQTVVGLDRN